MGYHLTINGHAHTLHAAAETPLLDVLRNDLRLVATRFGCGEERCGACMVLVDGVPAYACTRTLDTLDGKAVTTLEGLGTPDRPHPLQQAFLEQQAGQCGYCLSGILMSAKALLDANPRPTRADITAALDNHLCRCGAHNRIIAAIDRAAALLQDGAKP